MKKIIICIFLMFITIIKVDALSIEKNEITIKSGEKTNVLLTANVGEQEVSSIEFNLIYMSNDIPGNFIVSGYNNIITGTSHKIQFEEPVTGMVNLGSVSISVDKNPTVKIGEVKIYNAKATTTEGALIELNSQTITVTVDNSANENNTDIEVSNKADTGNSSENESSNEKKEETVENKEDSSRILERIDSDIVNIKLKDNVFEYTIKINKNIDLLDLKPILKDDSYKVEISTQKISELEDNKINIIISKDEYKETYTINIKIAEDIKKDEDKFVPSYSYKGKWTIIIIGLSIMLVIGLIFLKKNK